VKAQDIMTREVATVGPYTSVLDIAAIMVEKHISGVPVLTESGEIIGMVSQTDLLHRVELGTEQKAVGSGGSAILRTPARWRENMPRRMD
jgi:CBS domain-containing protein